MNSVLRRSVKVSSLLCVDYRDKKVCLIPQRMLTTFYNKGWCSVSASDSRLLGIVELAESLEQSVVLRSLLMCPTKTSSLGHG